MTEPVRAEGRYVTVTSKPDAAMTQEAAGGIAVLLDEMVDRMLMLKAQLDTEALIYGPSVLRVWLEAYVGDLKAEEAAMARAQSFLGGGISDLLIGGEE